MEWGFVCLLQNQVESKTELTKAAEKTKQALTYAPWMAMTPACHTQPWWALLLLLLLSRFSRVRLCATPQTAAHQALLSLGFSRQEHWSRLSHYLLKFVQICVH